MTRFVTIVEVSCRTPGRVASLLVPQNLVSDQVGSGHPDQVVRVAEQPFRVAHRPAQCGTRILLLEDAPAANVNLAALRADIDALHGEGA